MQSGTLRDAGKHDVQRFHLRSDVAQLTVLIGVADTSSSLMTPTRENIQLLVELAFGIAIFLSILLFVAEKLLRRKIKWGGFVVFALAAYGLPIVGFASKYLADRKTVRNEATTFGIVVAHDLANHNQYQFEYAVSGQRYYSWHQGTVDCDPGEMGIGRTYKVYYDPARPDKSDPCSFKSAVKNDLQILGLLSGMLALTAIFTSVKQTKESPRIPSEG